MIKIVTAFFFILTIPKLMSQLPLEKNYIYVVARIEKNFEDKILKKYHLRCIGSGGYLMYNVKSLELAFQHKGVLNKNDLRKLLIELTSQYLEDINSNEEIRPYLENYPFTPKNVDITIYLIDLHKQEIFYPNICIAESSYGTIRFKTVDEANPIAPFYTTEKETYEEALEKLKQCNEVPSS
ncbi:hypothetical protein [Criblamydia sequanensis]|nr:hypothetical protein [Criblamydia sequanensis]